MGVTVLCFFHCVFLPVCFLPVCFLPVCQMCLFQPPSLHCCGSGPAAFSVVPTGQTELQPPVAVRGKLTDVTLFCGDGQSVKAHGSNRTDGVTATNHSEGNLTYIILACGDEQSVEGHSVSLVPTGQTKLQPPVAMRGELNGCQPCLC